MHEIQGDTAPGEEAEPAHLQGTRPNEGTKSQPQGHVLKCVVLTLKRDRDQDF